MKAIFISLTLVFAGFAVQAKPHKLSCMQRSSVDRAGSKDNKKVVASTLAKQSKKRRKSLKGNN